MALCSNGSAATAAASVKWHNWWKAPQDLGQGEGDRSGRLARVVDGEFPWTRLAGVAMPAAQKPHDATSRASQPARTRREEARLLGDGNFRGLYQRSDEDDAAMWRSRRGDARPRSQDWRRAVSAGTGGVMLGFVIQRLLQAVVVMLVISALVFVGVYAIGNPIDVLISPDADQQHPRATRSRRYGLDQPLWQQYLALPRPARCAAISAAPSSSTCRCWS